MPACSISLGTPLLACLLSSSLSFFPRLFVHLLVRVGWQVDISMDAVARERMVALSGQKFLPQVHVQGKLIHGRDAMNELQEMEDNEFLLDILTNGPPE